MFHMFSNFALAMRKLITILLCLAGYSLLHAQEAPADTLYLVNGSKVMVHIKEMKLNKDQTYTLRTYENAEALSSLVVPLFGEDYSLISEFNSKGMRSSLVKGITFADGFSMAFEEGMLDRSQLLQAKKYNISGSRILAEGVVPLEDLEVSSLMGESAYYLGRNVYKTQRIAGGAKVAVATASLAASTALHARATWYDSNNDGSWKVSPQWYTVFPASASTLVYGMTEMTLSNLAIKKLSSNYLTFSAPSKKRFAAFTWAGGGLALAGGALIGLGHAYIMNKGTWYDLQTYDNDGNVFAIDKIGKLPPAWWIMPIAGAFMMNLGISGFTYGLSGLSGYKKISQNGREPQLSWSPTPYGVSLSLTF